MNMKKRFSAAALAFLLAACTHTAPQTAAGASSDSQSQSQRDAARAVLDQGIKAYQAQDYAAALPLFKQAEQLGHMKASRYLGLMALHGNGMAQSNARAFAYFQRAANEGDITGQYWLGYCYENGIGTARDYTQAMKWYTQSAQRGDVIAAPAMVALGHLYEQGKGVPANRSRAAAYYKQAMDAGYEEGKTEWQRLQAAQPSE